MDLSDLDALAAPRHGIVTSSELLARGWSPGRIDAARRRGALLTVHRGTYRTTGSPVTYKQNLSAACAAAGPDAAASHRAAADLLGLRLARPGTPSTLEISLPRGRLPRLRGVVVHRSRDLTSEQIEVIDGLRVTTPVRLLVDLGQVAPVWIVQRAMEQLLVDRRVTTAQVGAALEWHSRRGRTGCGVLRRALGQRALGEAAPDSVLEARFAELCHSADIPIGKFQYEVEIDGALIHIDFAHPTVKLAIEIDGYEWHSGREQFELDRRRDNALHLAGWTVLRFTWEQIVYRPAHVANVLHEALVQLEAA